MTDHCIAAMISHLFNKECVRKVKVILSELAVPPKFHMIHRAGRPKSAAKESEEGARSATRPRPILVRFVSRMDADLVWTKRKELLKSRLFPTVFIHKDLSAESAKERGKLHAAYKN